MDKNGRFGKWGLGIAGLIVATAAQALGLGDAQLLSALNEPLQARIPLRLAPGETIEQVRVALAADQAFAMLHIPQTALAYQLRFEVVSGPAPYIKVMAPTVVKDPIVQFPIQVTYGEGSSLTRGYTLFLKARALNEARGPAGMPATGSAAAPTPRVPAAQQSPVAGLTAPQKEASRSPDAPSRENARLATSQQASQSRPAPRSQQEPWPDEALPPPMRTTSTTQPQQVGRSPRVVPPQPGSAAPEETAVASRQQDESPADSDETAKAMPTTYGPVHSGETLFQVARTIQPHYEGASEARLAAALYRKNPTAFRSGHPGRLMKGRYLQVPTREEVAAMQPMQASRILRGQRVVAKRDMPAARGSAEARAPAPVSAEAEKPTTMAQDQSRGESAPQSSEQHSPAQERATVEFATRGRSSLADDKSAPAAIQLSHPAGTKQQLAEENAGGHDQAAATTAAPPASSPRVADQSNQPAVLPGDRGDTAGSSQAAAEPSSAPGPSPSVQEPQEEAHAQPSTAPFEPVPPVAVPPGQAQQAPSPAVPPPAKHQEGLGGQRTSVPWYIKLAVGIVGVACVLVGLIVFLSRRQRPEGAPTGAPTGQASREREKTAPGLGLGEVGSDAAEVMQQASELMACGLYQDAYGILEKALATDGGNNNRLRLKCLEAAAALGRFDEVRSQARLMESLDLGPDERAALQHLMQAIPQPDLAGATGPAEPSSATQASVAPSQPAHTAASPDPHLESTGFAGDAKEGHRDMVHDHEAFPEDLPPYASPAQAGHESADPDFDRWLTGGSTEQTQQDKRHTSRAEALPWDDDKPTSLADLAPTAVDFNPESSSHSSAPGPMQETDPGQPAVAWSSSAKTIPWHEEEPSMQGGATPPRDQEPIAPMDWSPSPERVPAHGTEGSGILSPVESFSSSMEAGAPHQGGLQKKDDDLAPYQPARQQDKGSTDRASVLARPWEQQPAVAARGHGQQGTSQTAQRELSAHGAGAAGSADEHTAVRGGEPGQGVTHGDMSIREEVGQPILEPQPIEKTTPNSLRTGDMSLSEPAQRPTQGMPAHEWPDVSSLSLSPADRRQEEALDAPWGRQHEKEHDIPRPAPAWSGETLELEPAGTQDPVLDISGMAADGLPTPAADSIQGYDFGQDTVEHEQERQVLEAYAHWGQVPQSDREQAGDMASGMPATQWTGLSEEQPAQEGSRGNAGMPLDERSIANEGPVEQRLATKPSTVATEEKDSIPDLSSEPRAERHGTPQSQAVHGGASESRMTSTGFPAWHEDEQKTHDHALAEEWNKETPAEPIDPDVLSFDSFLEQSSTAPLAESAQRPPSGTQPTGPAHDADHGPSERSRLLDRLTQLSRQRVDS